MKTCTHCGEYFQPKFSAAKLCMTCWQKRENAFLEYDDLKRQIETLQLAAALAVWDEPDEVIPPERIRQLLSLCHPDRHIDTPRELTATEVSQWLNKLKQSA